jgi:hypothetical protein
MIIAKESIKLYIRAQANISKFAESLNMTTMTLYNIMDGNNVSADSIAKLLQVSGFDFEKAFEMKEDQLTKGE